MNFKPGTFIFIFAIIFGVVAFNELGNPPGAKSFPLPYSSFIKEVKENTVKRVIIDNGVIKGESRDGDGFIVYALDDPHLINDLLSAGVEVRAATPKQRNIFLEIFISWFPMLLLIGVWILFMRRQNGGGSGFGGMAMGKSRAKLLSEESTKITFEDVAGCDEAKHDVAEIVDFLKDPTRYGKLGGRIPRGMLLVGPPGTGKTLLAKAVAGEAGVPFFSISGSDFVEMFVGVGASRVRDMFTEARKRAPCIVFIDEIDAIGKARNGSVMGNDERDQTLNALLVEMDGFEAMSGIIIIAATNRPEILDKALLRPGRFDRQVTVGLPDITGREQILKVHTKDVPMSDDVNLYDLARGTPGFSGAELANLVNEASILASKNDHDEVEMKHFEKAKDKLLMGAERKTFAMTEEEKRLTAYHEAGHAVVGFLSPEHDPIYKVSIIPRGRALGITMFLPERDTVSMSKRKIESQIASLYGGRIAEEIVAGEDGITTGASNDIERATTLATKMVTEWGMGKGLPPIKYVEDEGASYLGPGHAHLREGLDQTNSMVEEEIERIIVRNYSRAEELIKDNWSRMEAMVELLMEHETIDKDQIEEIMVDKEENLV